MPRARNPNIEKAFNIYKEHNCNITNREIANILNEDEKKIAVWKSRYKWDNILNVVQQKKKRCTTKRKTKQAPPTKEPKLKEELKQLENADLTDKQRLFCIYYIEDFNATKAYQKAYGCDYLTANANGSRLLVNASIKSEVDKLTEECLNEKEINSKLLAKRLFQKYIDIAFADITDFTEFGNKKISYIDKKGQEQTANINYVDFKNSTEVDGTLISEVKQGKSGISVKLHDKIRALNFLATNIGLLDMATKEKLRMEQEKLEILKRKNDDSEDGYQDDGFIEALQDSVKEVWEDEE